MRIQEDIGENWLKNNDPFFGKKKSIYFNNNRFRWVQRKEKPVGLMKNVLASSYRDGDRRVVT